LHINKQIVILFALFVGIITGVLMLDVKKYKNLYIQTYGEFQELEEGVLDLQEYITHCEKIVAKFQNEQVMYADIYNIKEIIKVKVSFYNPYDRNQTDSSPGICAWGHVVQPYDRLIAVSRDLLKEKILKENDQVVAGPFGKYAVLDKMNLRWTRRIDIAITDPTLSLEEKNTLARKLGVITINMIVLN